jgi:hypothetical protein
MVVWGLNRTVVKHQKVKRRMKEEGKKGNE